MKTKLCAAIVAGTLAFPALAGYGKDDTQIMFGFSGGANNARLAAEVLAQAERDRGGKPVAAHVDRFAGHSAGAMLALFLTLPQGSDGRPLSPGETLAHMDDHAPNILNSLMAGVCQPNKAQVQAEIGKHLGAAFKSSANLRVSQLPGRVEVLMAEVVKDEGVEVAVLPASFTAASAFSGQLPDVTLAELLTAAVSVEMLSGHVPLTGPGEDGKSARTFMDAGSRGRREGTYGTTDPAANLLEAAKESGKPAHIFVFDFGFGFDGETLAWAERTLQVEEKLKKGIPLEDADQPFARVRVHLFHPTRPEYQACAACTHSDGKQTPCTVHPANLSQLISVPPTAGLYTIALNLQAGNATREMNAKLKQVAQLQMIGKSGAPTASYAKLLSVLAEADAAKGGSTSAAAALESKNTHGVATEKAGGKPNTDPEARG